MWISMSIRRKKKSSSKKWFVNYSPTDCAITDVVYE